MSGTRRRAISTPGERKDPARRGPASIALSVAIHVIAIAILVRVLAIVPIRWADILRPPPEPKATHVEYVRLPTDSVGRRRAGGDNRPATGAPPAAPLVAPTEVPSTLPPAPPKSVEPAAPAEGGSGPVVGGGGPTKGVTPQFTDPRLWAPSEPVPVRPKTSTERLDSA
ncbi:MAG: hypothetical protein ACHQQR_12775, partial [Gemmatimonadales bacterium]